MAPGTSCSYCYCCCCCCYYYYYYYYYYNTLQIKTAMVATSSLMTLTNINRHIVSICSRSTNC